MLRLTSHAHPINHYDGHVGRVIPIVIAVALTIYTFIDVLRTSGNSMPGRISKPWWAILVLILPVIGPLLWIYFKNQAFFRADNTITGDSFKGRFGGRKKQTGPVAPDDDPEFLARLEAQNRRRAYEEKRREELGEESAPSAPTPDEEDNGGLYGKR